MVALTGSDDELVSPADATGWKRHTTQTDAFETKVFPGGHFFVVEEEEEVVAYVQVRPPLDPL
eukprot:621415-Pyramimonas_sp.AAC.1